MPNASAFPEIVEAAECGVLVEPNSPDALARGIQAVFNNPEREVLGKKGRRAVKERYHVGAMAAGFEKVFGKVVRK
jgi:glycosyltransferase involved in cell wall biosynthesis